eukprot:Phypoly_transcript_08240.p1 GENE.Phypoly_transcript_08240~~Phypoly_transcript_08240.p1  ORF type:complete len:198 (-),score=33.29 Phypoly_transcript_08240:75-668(-)
MVADGDTFHSLPGNYQIEKYNLLSKISKLQNVDVNEFLHFINDQVSDRPVPLDSIFLSKEVKPLVEAYKLFFKQVVNLGLSKEQVIEDLKKANVSENIISMCVDAITARWPDTKKALETMDIHVSPSTLADFDWKVNLISSSDRISTVQETVLLLNLTTQEGSGKKEEVLVELTKEQLDSLLETLSNVNEAVQNLKV